MNAKRPLPFSYWSSQPMWTGGVQLASPTFDRSPASTFMRGSPPHLVGVWCIGQWPPLCRLGLFRERMRYPVIIHPFSSSSTSSTSSTSSWCAEPLPSCDDKALHTRMTTTYKKIRVGRKLLKKRWRAPGGGDRAPGRGGGGGGGGGSGARGARGGWRRGGIFDPAFLFDITAWMILIIISVMIHPVFISLLSTIAPTSIVPLQLTRHVTWKIKVFKLYHFTHRVWFRLSYLIYNRNLLTRNDMLTSIQIENAVHESYSQYPLVLTIHGNFLFQKFTIKSSKHLISFQIAIVHVSKIKCS